MPFKKGHKPVNKGKSRASLAANSTPAPAAKEDVDDETMLDADDGVDDTGDIIPPEDGEDDDAATPAQDDDEDDDDEDGAPRITTIPRRRGRGRGGARSSRRYDGTPEAGDDGSESGTPYRRRRGRPSGFGRGGFRGRRRQQPEAPHVVYNGEKVEVMDDEAQIDQDDEGDAKVDANGQLQGGREYRVRTFKIIGKDERLYMLSTEPARCCGFRDSYLFFAKHPKLFKVLLGEAEKKDLIERDILPNSYKGRNIGVVTARSVFREFGARIVVGGKKITDDYKVAEARANGDVEGELADPNDRVVDDGKYDRNRYVAWFGASEVYRNATQTGTTTAGKPAAIGSKRRNNITVGNWQFMHAKEASRFNSITNAMRASTHNGVYDAHTNLMFMPKITQPTHARWEQIPPPSPTAAPEPKLLTNGDYHPTTNGDTNHDAMDISATQAQQQQQQQQPTIFSDVPAIISRNFAVIDTHYTSPPISNPGFPGPDNLITDPTSGSTGLSNIPSDLLDELPEDCRKAFEEERRRELEWKKQWGTEGQSCMRGGLRVGLAGWPV